MSFMLFKKFLVYYNKIMFLNLNIKSATMNWIRSKMSLKNKCWNREGLEHYLKGVFSIAGFSEVNPSM